MTSNQIVVHRLKCWPEFFEAIWDGSKPFEIREDDRDYAVGHNLHLQEWDPKTEKYTGREITKQVTYITDWAQRNDYVVMGLR